MRYYKPVQTENLDIFTDNDIHNEFDMIDTCHNHEVEKLAEHETTKVDVVSDQKRDVSFNSKSIQGIGLILKLRFLGSLCVPTFISLPGHKCVR